MKITDTIISIPPYISTTWDNVASLHMEEGVLFITLREGGKTVAIAALDRSIIEQIFSAHASFLEAHLPVHPVAHPRPQRGANNIEQLFTFPFRLGAGLGAGGGGAASIESMGQVLQHNPVYSELPPIPEEVANKIATLSKIISEEEILAMPAAEANCNCMYCQINRILRKEVLKEENTLPDHPALGGEKISSADLHFDQWKVELVGDKIYQVTNKLDPQEQYTVHLKDPIGCTCGKSNCEHIVAVLRS